VLPVYCFEMLSLLLLFNEFLLLAILGEYPSSSVNLGILNRRSKFWMYLLISYSCPLLGLSWSMARSRL
jgi:hypothetical protein